MNLTEFTPLQMGGILDSMTVKYNVPVYMYCVCDIPYYTIEEYEYCYWNNCPWLEQAFD